MCKCTTTTTGGGLGANVLVQPESIALYCRHAATAVAAVCLCLYDFLLRLHKVSMATSIRA